MKKRYPLALALALATFAGAALAVSGLEAEPTSKPPVDVAVTNTPWVTSRTIEPVQVCSPVYNPTQAYTVPAGRLLVIEDATVSANCDTGEVMFGIITTAVGGVEADFYVGMVSGDVFRFSKDGRSMTAYADPGTSVVVKAARRNAPDNMEICFSGHLEPVSMP